MSYADAEVNAPEMVKPHPASDFLAEQVIEAFPRRSLPPRPVMSVPYQFNSNHVRRFLNFIINPIVGCAEFRIFKADVEQRGNRQILAADLYSKTLGGWFDDVERFICQAGRLRGVSGFITINPVRRDFLARINNDIRKIDKNGGTSDTDIVCLSKILIDIDSKRATDISATDAELDASLSVMEAILAAHPEIKAASLWGCSGNGGWIVPRIPDLPNDPGHNAMVARFLDVLDRKFSNERVKIDPKTKNPSRVMGVIGCQKCKGSHYQSKNPDEHRPWRLSTIMAPDDHEPGVLDLKRWLAEHDDGATVKIAATQAGNRRPACVQTIAGDTKEKGPISEEERARRYVFKMDDSISGHDGHKQLYNVAVVLINDFGLARDEAFSILAEWNQTKSKPPESECQLNHKIDDAIKNCPIPSLSKLNAAPTISSDTNWWGRYLDYLANGCGEGDNPSEYPYTPDQMPSGSGPFDCSCDPNDEGV